MKNFNLPNDYRPFIDKYFLRAKEILEKERLNPMVKAQVFIRKGDCNVYGIDEAIAILTKYSTIENTGKIFSLKEGEHFKPKETLMIIEAPIQTIIDLETMYLGVLSAETTMQNDKIGIDQEKIRENMSKIVDLVSVRPVSYFGARHWRYDMDYKICNSCAAAGVMNCSTDIGAKAWGNELEGVGTIPHALETIYHWKYGLDRAVVEATKAFDKHIDKDIPRIALVDYANREITDTFNTYKEVKSLYGIRIDTCGENFMQSLLFDYELPDRDKGVSLPGVTNFNGYLWLNELAGKFKIILSSGFGNIEKVKEFVEYEDMIEQKIFDGLGVGGVFPSRMATMDIIEVAGKEIHKVGRNPKPNERLKRIV